MSSLYGIVEDYCYLEDFDTWEYDNGKYIFIRYGTGMYSSERRVLTKENLINWHYEGSQIKSNRNNIQTSVSEDINSKNIFNINKNSLIRNKDLLIEYVNLYNLNVVDKNKLIKMINKGQFHTLGDLEEQCVRLARRKKATSKEIEDYANYYCKNAEYNNWDYDKKDSNKIVFKLLTKEGKYVSKMKKIEVRELTMLKKEAILSMMKL